MRKKSNEQTLQEAIQLMLKTYHLHDKYSELNVTENWEQLVGSTIAKRTSSVSIKNKKLYIRLTSSSLRNDMLMAKSAIIDLVNERAGQELIEDVIIS